MVYLQQNPGSNTAFITNSKINFTSGEEAADDNDVQTTNLAEGEYEACATTEGFPNEPFANTAQTCTSFPTKPWPFLNGRAVRAVRQNAVRFKALNFCRAFNFFGGDGCAAAGTLHRRRLLDFRRRAFVFAR